MNRQSIFQNIAMALVGIILLFSSCLENDLLVTNTDQEVPEGYVAISFKAQIPDMTEVQTRAVDPDGLDIHNLKLFCFNQYHIFITVEYATLTTQDHDNHTGEYTAIIPSDTHIIHFVANQNIGQYNLSSFAGKTESEVLSSMEGGSGMMIYWRRFEKGSDNESTILEDLSKLNNSSGISLIRNQAKVSIKKDEGYPKNFTVTGFRTTNIYAYGTVAPYRSETSGIGFPVQFPHNFVTTASNKAKLSDIIDINTAEADYIFEHENDLNDPVSVIIKGTNEGANEALYYRVLLLDGDGNPLPVLRNHHYQIQIKGKLSYGQQTFEEALTAPATNNVWVAVDDWVNEISAGGETLGVEETHIVLDQTYAGKDYEFEYTSTNELKSTDVTWLDDNKVANNNVQIGGRTNNKGKIKVSLKPMADDVNQQSGTLMLKMGQMYRKVNITVVKTMEFTPSWVSSNVHKEAGENITLKFTIPDECPEGLFPFPVMISVNDLDVRSASGMQLPVRIPGEVDWYGTSNDLGYKYEYLVEGPGVHRLYFETILPHENNEHSEAITLEAKFFNTLTKSVRFSDNNHEIVIPTVSNNNPWGFFSYFNPNAPIFQRDEPIYYLLVPQKMGAEVNFEMQLKDREAKDSNGNYTYTEINATSTDEFFLFSKTLNIQQGENYVYNTDFDSNPDNDGVIDASKLAIGDGASVTNGRSILFWPKNGTSSSFILKTKTNKAKSADVVRLASNNDGLKSFKDPTSTYAGNEYRSRIFELANYRPFGFAAQISVNHGTAQGTWGVNNVYQNDNSGIHVEPIDDIEISYAPDQHVHISFDVTSFMDSENNKEVDPFGQQFYIYIDAPMLELGNLSGTGFDNKIRKASDGRFVYTVDANRDNEKISDTHALSSGIVQERKVIPFVKRGITSGGEIVISSDENKVVFYQKKFKIKNQLMTGTIKYRETASSTLNNVPKDAFVAFIRTATNSRIGVMTITADGQYSLNLRSEYVFNWTDNIELVYKVGDVVYECNSISNGSTNVPLTLESLFTYKNVVLTKAVGTTTP